MNLARLFGLHYYRYQAKDGLTGTNGTVIDIDNVTDLVRQVVISSQFSLVPYFFSRLFSLSLVLYPSHLRPLHPYFVSFRFLPLMYRIM